MEELEEFNILPVEIHAMERVERNQRLADDLTPRRQVDHAEQIRRRLERLVTVVTYHNRAANQTVRVGAIVVA